MGWTKRQYIEQAFDELGLAGYVFDLTPEQVNSALRRLDSMIASWVSNGVRFNWALSNNPNDSDLDANTNAPDCANEAIYSNLAIRLSSSFGKAVPAQLSQFANMSYSNLIANLVTIPNSSLYPTTMPMGAGNKTSYGTNQVYYPQTDSDLEIGTSGSLTFE